MSVYKCSLLLICCITNIFAQECGYPNDDDIELQPPPKHTNIVLIGATGDLAKKYLWKSLFNLFTKHYIKGINAV